MRSIYCRFCMKVEIYKDEETQKWLEVSNNQIHKCPALDPNAPNLPKKCSCDCGCKVDIRGTIEEIAGEPYLCEGCMHGDCDIEAMNMR